ncbi:ABC transporter permease [Serinicoccus marinus]|uniref:ABC transporter permease n=1 Tax=Serinicoccus marinus TaxID=247333 RepID=UPI00248F7FBF|nr:ABC transporter permease [Serinicoccus marinus]
MTTRSPSAAPALRPVGRRPPLATYVRQLWQRRHFIYADSRARAFHGHRDMLLGNLWLIGVPILQGLVYFIIFGLVLRTSRGIENFPGFLMVGIFLFTFTTSCLNQSVTSLRQARGLTTAFSFPRAAIPLAVIVRETLSMGPVLATLGVLLLVVPPGTQVTWTWALFPAVFGLQVLFNTGLSLYCARLGAAVPDIKHVVTFLSRFWFYTSGVFFSVERFVSDGIWLGIMKTNPMYLVLDMSRDLLLYDTVPELRYWAVLAVWALVTGVLGLWYFWQGEETYGQP